MPTSQMDEAAIQVLSDLLRQRGRQLCGQPRLLRAFLLDLAAPYRRETNLLVQAAELQIAAELAALGDQTLDPLLAARLAQRLMDDHGLAPEAAHWAVRAWAHALGMQLPPRKGTAPIPTVAASAGVPARALHTIGDPVNSIAWSRDGRIIACGCRDGAIRLWRPGDLALLRELKGHKGSVFGLAWHPDGTLLASAGEDKSARIWRTDDGSLLRTLSGHENWVTSVAWSPNGQALASGSNDQTVRTWQALTTWRLGLPRHTLAGHELPVNGVAWSPDGSLIASASGDDVLLWRATDGQLERKLLGAGSLVFCLAWSPDGNHLASAGYDRAVRIWHVASGQQRQTLVGHKDWVRAVAWSPDGSRLASAGRDRTVRVWEAAGGQQRHALAGHQGDVLGLAWSPDGNHLASAGWDGTVRLWQV